MGMLAAWGWWQLVCWADIFADGLAAVCLCVVHIEVNIYWAEISHAKVLQWGYCFETTEIFLSPSTHCVYVCSCARAHMSVSQFWMFPCFPLITADNVERIVENFPDKFYVQWVLNAFSYKLWGVYISTILPILKMPGAVGEMAKRSLSSLPTLTCQAPESPKWAILCKDTVSQLRIVG